MRSLFGLLVLTSTTAFANGIPSDDSLREFIEGQREITSLSEIEREGLNQRATRIDLWSGHYWPTYQGGLGIRYRDPLFISIMERNEKSFSSYKKLKDKRPYYIYRNDEVNLLSPSEKYDLLVGDSSMSLTKYSWDLGSNMVGSVPTWRGVCDGWSSASQKMPRPSKSVEMTTPSGQKITFFPEDIKAIGSQFYARNQDVPLFVGKRCMVNIPNPFSNACNATHPATFHKTLVNRVGKLGKTFIADIDPRSEVWNYPVKSYNFKYYNVLTDDESDDFRVVAEPFKKKYRFKRFLWRHPKTQYIVGVVATVNFADMRPAPLSLQDGAEYDKVLTKTYDYDLELDKEFNIIGGEVQAKVLPDFLWIPQSSAYPLSEVEEDEGMVNNPQELASKAKKASKEGQLLSTVVQELFELSK